MLHHYHHWNNSSKPDSKPRRRPAAISLVLSYSLRLLLIYVFSPQTAIILCILGLVSFARKVTTFFANRMQLTILNNSIQVSGVVIRGGKWCAKRTTPCLTAYPDERSEEGCAVGVRRCGQCAERTACYKSSFRYNLFFLMCGTLCAPLHPLRTIRAPLVATLLAVRG